MNFSYLCKDNNFLDMLDINTGQNDTLFEYKGLQYIKGTFEVYCVIQDDGILITEK